MPRYFTSLAKKNIHIKTCLQRFIAALLMITKNLGQTKRPAMGEQINRSCCSRTMKYQQQKGNASDTHKMGGSQISAQCWVKEGCWKAECYSVPFLWLSGEGKTVRAENIAVVSRGRRWEKELTIHELYKEFGRGVMGHSVSWVLVVIMWLLLCKLRTVY